jgi:putative transposase
MPRPLRIEYENAYYHVMNRGRGKENIFHSDEYYHTFLSTLSEAHSRFGLQVLCYCLMSNHYHLLVKTPEANLGRIMRHINGVYTQRHNRLKKTDGSLFRGRYKAILVEQDSYQLQLSRYIHLNPIEAGIENTIEDYSWSSYPHYIKPKEAPDWLSPDEILNQFSPKKLKHRKYQSFVEMGVDEEIKTFYGKKNLMPFLGSDDFRAWAYEQQHTDEQFVNEYEKKAFRPHMDKIVKDVAEIFNVPVKSVLTGVRGQTNIPRWAAMYLCQEVGSHQLVDIAKHFGLQRTGSLPIMIAKFREYLKKDKALKNKIVQYYT